MSRNPTLAYREVATKVGSPVGLVVLLYDAAINSLQRALKGFEANRIEQRTADLNHALLVVGELQASLDFERGGEVARRLRRFYELARARILEANLTNSAPFVRRLLEQFISLREAWHTVERANPQAPAPARPNPAADSGQEGRRSSEPPGSIWKA